MGERGGVYSPIVESVWCKRRAAGALRFQRPTYLAGSGSTFSLHCTSSRLLILVQESLGLWSQSARHETIRRLSVPQVVHCSRSEDSVPNESLTLSQVSNRPEP
jgi:hypothetical protein